MGIDMPSDEFYTVNTNQSGPPMSAKHIFQPRLLRPNQNPNIPKETNQTEMDWSYLLARTYLLTFEPWGQKCSTEIYC